MQDRIAQTARDGIRDLLIAALTPEQRKPLFRKERNACILASAGSGKTHTLVHALAKELLEGTPPEGVIAFTFTNKAADELLARVHSIVLAQSGAIDITGLSVGTIHAWCFDFLRQEPQFYNFDSIDELHLDSLVARCYERLQLASVYGKRFPFGIEPFLKDLEIYYNECLPLDEVPERIRPAISVLLQTLRENRLLTYGDMVRHATDLLREKYASGLPGLECLFVDEYQDVNPAQVELIKAMRQPSTRLVVVGDELQCIYQWRGSDVRRIVQFTLDFPESEVFPLVRNRRARPSLIEFANKVAQNVAFRVPRVMLSHRPATSAGTVYLVHSEGEEDQARNIARMVRNLRRNGVAYSDIAILLRSVSTSGAAIAEALRESNIPFECLLLSRSIEFIECCLEPLFDWLRQDSAEPRNEQEARDVEVRRVQLWRAFRRFLPRKAPERRFWYALADWQQLIAQADRGAYDVRGCLYAFFDDIDLHIGPDDRDLMLALGIATQIIRSIEEIQRRRIRGLSRKNPQSVMGEVYYALRRWKDEFGETRPIDTSSEAVVISTIHQAKGLEWPVVIVPTLNRGKFPVRSGAHGTSFPDTVARRYGTSIEDEWRLFYVAVTRAEERLFLMDYGSTSDASIFVETLRDECTELDRTDLTNACHSAWRIEPTDHPNERRVVRIALSDLLIYMECPYQYALRRVCEVQPSVSDELGYGRSLHELVQRRLDNGQPWEEEQLEQQVDKHVYLPYTSDEQERRSKAAIKKRIESLERLSALDKKAQAEVRTEMLLEGCSVHGVADGIYLTDDGAYIRDWKSNVHDSLLQRYTRQITFYAVVLSERGLNVKGAEIVDIGASHKKGELVSVPVDCSAAAVRLARAEFAAAVRRLADRDFTPKPSKQSCSCCDMYRLCAVRVDVSEPISDCDSFGGGTDAETIED